MTEQIRSITTYDKYLLLLIAEKARNSTLACDLVFRLKLIDTFKGCWFLSNNWADYFKIKDESAHRLSYKAFIDDLKFNHEICHHCDRKGCINPWHLFQGTHSDNIQDAISKGRLWPIKVESNKKYSKENKIKIEEAKKIMLNVDIFGSAEELDTSYRKIKGI